MEARDLFSRDEEYEAKKKRKPVFLVWAIIVLIITGSILVINSYWDIEKDSIGKRAVQYMYTFKDANELGENMIKLKDITTDRVFQKLTVTDSDRALNTYLKFRGSAVEADIISESSSSTGGYVLYTLHTDSISAGRKFLFLYELDGGVISYARELEGIDFYENK